MIKAISNSLFSEYQNNIFENTKDSGFVFVSADKACFVFHKTSLKRSGWYIESSDLLKNKEATVNSKNNEK